MITSTSNPQVKEIMQLQKKSKLRRELGVFVAEGMKMVSEAPAGRIERCWISAVSYTHLDVYKRQTGM